MTEEAYSVIRAFLAPWMMVDDGEGGTYAQTPIEAWCSENNPPWRWSEATYFNTPDGSNVPTIPFVLVLVKAKTNECDALASLPGVDMIPPQPFDRSREEVSATARGQITILNRTYGIPDTVWGQSATYGEYLEGIVRYWQPAFTGFGVTVADYPKFGGQ